MNSFYQFNVTKWIRHQNNTHLLLIIHSILYCHKRNNIFLILFVFNTYYICIQLIINTNKLNHI